MIHHVKVFIYKVFMAFLLAQGQSDNDVEKAFMVLSSFEKQRICPS